MRMKRSARTAMFVSMLMALSAGAAFSKDGRDFVGNYALAGVAEHGDQVDVTLTLRLMNYSGAGLNRAVVAVHGAQAGAELLATFPAPGGWRQDRDVVVEKELTVSRAEYLRWRHAQPRVFVVDTDERGLERRRWVQLSRRPVIRQARGVER